MNSEMRFMLGLDKPIHKAVSVLHTSLTEEQKKMISVKRSSKHTISRALLGL